MADARIVALIAAAFACCAAAGASGPWALPEPRVLAPLALACAGLAALGRRRRH